MRAFVDDEELDGWAMTTAVDRDPPSRRLRRLALRLSRVAHRIGDALARWAWR